MCRVEEKSTLIFFLVQINGHFLIRGLAFSERECHHNDLDGGNKDGEFCR